MNPQSVEHASDCASRYALRPESSPVSSLPVFAVTHPRCTCNYAKHCAEAIVAAGWGHPDDLTDEQVRYLTAIEEPTVFWNTETDFRAELARANKGEKA